MSKPEIAYLREQVAEASLLRNFSKEEIDQILPYFDYKSFENNTLLFEEGERGDYMCVVVEGTIEIRKESVSSKQTVSAKFGRGSAVGEMALIDQFPRSSTARVTANSRLLTMTRERFDELLATEPELGIKFLREIARILSQRLRRTSGRFSDIF